MSSKGRPGSKRPRSEVSAPASTVAKAIRGEERRGVEKRGEGKRGPPLSNGRSSSKSKKATGKTRSTPEPKLAPRLDFDISSDEELDEERSVEDIPSTESRGEEETADAKRRRLAHEMIAKYTAEAKEDATDEEDDDGAHDVVGRKLLEASMASKVGSLIMARADFIGEVLSSGKLQTTFVPCHKLSPTCVSVTGDGKRMFVGSKDCSVSVWEISGSESHGLKPLYKLPGRRRTKADVLKQERAAARAKESGETPGSFTGVRHVVSVGFGGGRLGGDERTGVSKSDGPTIVHKDGVSSITVTTTGAAPADATSKRAIISKLRTVPDYGIPGHWAEVLAVAVSDDGRFLATAGKDRVIRVWDTTSKTPSGPPNVENFVGHKDTITGLVFRKDSHVLYSCSADRMVKQWNLDEMAYVDTLFGHQADILAIDAVGGKDRCVTAGRDRTVRLWKIPEQTQLVFRAHASDVTTDVVAAINDSWYISGGADGSLSLWHTTKKKPIVRIAAAHGSGYDASGVDVRRYEPAEEASFDASILPTAHSMTPASARAICEQTGLKPDSVTLSSGYCNWITALAVCPNSDLLASGAGDGYIRLWKLVTAAGERRAGDSDSDSERNAPNHALLLGQETQRPSAFSGLHLVAALPVKGIVNGLRFSADGSSLAAAVGQEHRLGRWWHYSDAVNGLVHIPLPQIR